MGQNLQLHFVLVEGALLDIGEVDQIQHRYNLVSIGPKLPPGAYTKFIIYKVLYFPQYTVRWDEGGQLG